MNSCFQLSGWGVDVFIELRRTSRTVHGNMDPSCSRPSASLEQSEAPRCKASFFVWWFLDWIHKQDVIRSESFWADS
jgi:hypothetical protein